MTHTVNRVLADKDMDRIDHALGRPLDPLGPTYRNHYNIGILAADDMHENHWTVESCNRGSSVTFNVTQAGREALAAHLKAIKDPWRLYRVTFDLIGDHGQEEHVIEAIAKSHGQARYRAWGLVIDGGWSPSFGDFCKRSSVRMARKPEPEVVF